MDTMASFVRMRSPQTQKRSDRRVRKTREAIQNALLALIAEKGFEAIVVEDIIQRADIGRSTFYTHFADKEDALRSRLEELRSWIQHVCASSLRPGSPFPFTIELLRHADSFRPVYRSLMGRQSAALVLRWFADLVADLVRAELAPKFTSPRALTQFEPTVQFTVGAFMSLTTWWLEAPSPCPPEELDASFSVLAGAVVSAALSGGARPSL